MVEEAAAALGISRPFAYEAVVKLAFADHLIGDRDALVVYGTGEHEYYDLRTDPYELTNLAGDPSTLQARIALRRRLHVLCDPPPPGMRRP